MKFTISQSALAKALGVVSKGMGANSTLPILSGIYLRAGEGQVEFQTNNLTISVRHIVPANVEEEGETVVSGKVLNNIVKALGDDAVTFDGDGRVLSLSSGRSNYRLNTLSASDWSAFPEVEPTATTELPAELLGTMVGKVYKVTSKETSRPILQGILLTVEDNTIRLVATDSFRLAVCDSAVEAGGGSFRAILPGSVFHDVISMAADAEKVRIGTTESQVVFTFGNTTFVSRRIEGNFPDYKQLLPPTCATALSLDAAGFSAALKRVSVVAQANGAVRFDIDADGGFMRLSASSPDQGEAVEEVAADVEGASVAIALNYHYVFDCVNAVSGADVIRLELQTAAQPGIFKVNGRVNYLYLLMPVRL